jgi:hypothetical protein
VILLNFDGMAPLESLRLTGWARGDISQVGGNAGIVVEDHPAYSTRWVEQQISD